MMINNIKLFAAALAAVAAGAPLAGVAAEDPVKVIAAKLPGVDPTQITAAPIDGVYEIGLGTNIAYVSADARYLLKGDIIDLDSDTNLTEQRRSTARIGLIDALGEDNMIIFSPAADKVKYDITVFTDIDCGYCRKLHREMAQLNGLGVRVRYVFYPRSGPNTASWKKAEEVWCAKDRNDALTRAKAGEELDSESCGATPVAEQWEMGRSVGLRGTPAIITDDGEMIAGYLPAAQLVSRLESAKRLTAAAR